MCQRKVVVVVYHESGGCSMHGTAKWKLVVTE